MAAPRKRKEVPPWPFVVRALSDVDTGLMNIDTAGLARHIAYF